jgi:hypothetical protein
VKPDGQPFAKSKRNDEKRLETKSSTNLRVNSQTIAERYWELQRLRECVRVEELRAAKVKHRLNSESVPSSLVLQ